MFQGRRAPLSFVACSLGPFETTVYDWSTDFFNPCKPGATAQGGQARGNIGGRAVPVRCVWRARSKLSVLLLAATRIHVYTAWHLVVWYLHRRLHGLPVGSYVKYQPASNGLNPQGVLRNINNGLRTITDSPSPPPSSSLIHRPCCSHH